MPKTKDMGNNALSLVQVLPADQQFKLAFIDIVRSRDSSWFSKDFDDFTTQIFGKFGADWTYF